MSNKLLQINVIIVSGENPDAGHKINAQKQKKNYAKEIFGLIDFPFEAAFVTADKPWFRAAAVKNVWTGEIAMLWVAMQHFN